MLLNLIIICFSLFFHDLITEEEPPVERRNRMNATFIPAQCLSLELCDEEAIFSRKAGPRVKEGKAKEGEKRGGGEEEEEEGRGEKEENKFAGTGETTRARRENVEKRFLAV